ncbi:MAG: RNA polymerase sigma factor [Eubacterium sp.]|nr:RNA polymerase sigma factor [Eubacterium sp.]MCM1214445.1 RNA polymerase sigma factor [Lachnospiraceae bacterium]MCM1238735.1 RNA polymerase sigma factor [Lachnospiraceae bacterium]
MDFDSIYRNYFRDVYFYIYGIARSESLAEEITQETFVKALKAIDGFDGGKDIRAWLFTIARNTFYTCCRRRKIYAEQPLDENTDAPGPSLVDRIVDEETAFCIHRFLHEMREPYKEVFTLRVFGELSYERIGTLFGKSAGWARVIFYRAKKQINDYLEQIAANGN